LGLTPQYLPAEAHNAIQQPSGDVFHQISAVECVLHLGNALLRDADVNSMANSLEIRVPFVSRSIVDLVTPLREHVKSPLGKPPKHLLRDAIAGRIPDLAMRRNAVKTALPYQQWMYGPLRESCEAAVQELAACPLMPSGVVHELWTGCSPDHGVSDGAIPMSLVTLGSYLGQRKSRSVASN
jgi:asparagine synthase (glutamine-hydrolysing)